MFLPTAAVVLFLLIVATICDFRTREIPDVIAVLVAAVAMMASALGWLGIGPLWVAAGATLGLATGVALYRWAGLGGGDAKLIAALGAVVGPAGLLIVLFGMAMAGGVLALIAMSRGQRDYAYVPAITAGFVWYIGVISLL